jgi:hypothetical protein
VVLLRINLGQPEQMEASLVQMLDMPNVSNLSEAIAEILDLVYSNSSGG